jgi:Ca2+-binding RTX toxin-like protein
MQDLTHQAVDAAPSEWLDTGSNDASGTLYGGKGNPPPPPPPPPPEDPSVIHGTDGDDILQATTGDNTIYGGKGQDTVEFHGVLGDYGLSFDPIAWAYRVTDKVSGRDGSDLLNGIERLQFDGITVLLGHDGSAHLEDGTELLAPYAPPPPPDGWTVVIGPGDPLVPPLPYEGGDHIVIAVDQVETTLLAAHWVAHANADDIALNGIATLAVDLPFGDA